MLITTLLAVILGVMIPERSAGRIKDACRALGSVWLGGLACGFISLLALRQRRPLVDEVLRAADQALGFDGPAYAEWITHQHRGFVMALTGAYNMTTIVLFASMAAAALRGQRRALWRATSCFTGSLLIVCLVSVITPAKGVGMWMDASTLAQLPPGAATYFWSTFEQFHGAAVPVLSFAAIDGVVSFPSFHIIMGLITVTLWRGRPVAFATASIWFALMLMATIPLGGHYVVDLLGGATIWAAWSLGGSKLQLKGRSDRLRWVERRMVKQPVLPA